jgi:hypothetical protein
MGLVLWGWIETWWLIILKLIRWVLLNTISAHQHIDVSPNCQSQGRLVHLEISGYVCKQYRFQLERYYSLTYFIFKIFFLKLILFFLHQINHFLNKKKSLQNIFFLYIKHSCFFLSYQSHLLQYCSTSYPILFSYIASIIFIL